ncbi:hypothetical protein [Streptomyces sp. NPDC059874]
MNAETLLVHRGGAAVEEPLSAQPEHTPIRTYAPARGAPADLLAQLRAKH